MLRQKHTRVAVALATLVCAFGARLPAGDLEQFLEKISSEDKDVRYEARLGAGSIGAPAVAPLVELMAGGSREVSISSLRALEVIVHHAGRPGHAAEARAVSAELAALLTADTAKKTRLELLHLIAFIGDDAIVPAVASMLEDPDRHVRETARLALERIPGPRAVEALIRAARGASPERKGDFLFSLGKKGDLSVVRFLVSNTSGPQDDVRLSALQALAHLGAPEAIDRFESELEREDSQIRGSVFNEYLRLADNLARAGRNRDAERIYHRCLVDAPLDHQRERGLYQLTKSGGPGAIDDLVRGLGDSAERVRRLAMRRLPQVKGKEVATALRRAYAGAANETRAFLLRAIAKNDPEGSATLIEEATRDADPGVKVTALDIRGELAQPELEPVYIELAGRGSPSVRTTAVKGYLEIAQKRLEDAESETSREKAGAMFAQALEIAPAASQKVAAIEGLKKVGDPKFVDRLEPYLTHAVLGSSASDVYMDIAVKLAGDGDIDKAEPLLLKVLDGPFPRELKVRAADTLRDAGRDPQAHVVKEGFVLDWWLIGPFFDRGGDGLERTYFPESERPDDEEHRIGRRRYRWQHPRLLTTTGIIDLAPRFRRSDERLCYGYTEVVSPKEQDVLFKIGSDDGVACWLNGERIHFNPATRGLTVDPSRRRSRRGRTSSSSR